MQATRKWGRGMDMTKGALFPSIIRFILPLIVTNLLHQFYNAADIMVVGLSPEADAVGAVGSAGSYLSLITNVFIGFSVGANVVVARHIGAGDREKTAHAVHTAICMSLLFGALGAVVGIAACRAVLLGMGYTGNLLTLAVRYSYIYLGCMPFLALTNFLSAILQAQGNTKTPMLVLTLSGLLNIGLNMFFVLALHLSVEGVAIATAIANLASACALWYYLAKRGDVCRVSFRRLRVNREQFALIARIGFPAGIQNALFSISNILIQSSVLQVNNALTPPGSAYAPVIKGSTATGSLENFIFTALGAVTVTASAFTAQNMGAGNYRRVRRAFGLICLVSTVIALVMSAAGMLLREPLLSLYGVKQAEDTLAVITYDAAMVRMLWKWPAFFIYSIMNACAGTIRGLGKSGLAALVTFFGTCVFRVVWIYTAFRYFQNLESIFISYPISWLLTGAVFLVLLMCLLKRRIQDSDTSVSV